MCYNALSVRRKLVVLILTSLLGVVVAILAASYSWRPGGEESATLFAEEGESMVQRGPDVLSLAAPGKLEGY